jgi:CBS domain-containing protein
MNDQIILEEETIAAEQDLEAARLGNAISRRQIGTLPTLKEPVCVSPGTSLREAIDKMNERRVGCVLVQEKGKLVGVFTERDVLTKVVGRNLAVDSMPVAELMTRDPECLTLEDGIAYALNKMSIGGFRHIPLVDDQHRPTGVVAMRNIVDFIVDLFPEEVLNLPPSPGHVVTSEREGA